MLKELQYILQHANFEQIFSLGLDFYEKNNLFGNVLILMK